MASITTDRLDGVNTAVAIKAPVVVATTANITLSGAQTIDSVAVVAGDRVLVKDQTTTTENGIYVVETSTWTRAKDFDGSRDVVTGTVVYVQSGTDNGGGWFRQTTTGTITIGTSAIVWAALAFNVAALYSTSTTSLAVGTGSKSFTVSSGRAWLAGQRLRAADSTSAYIMEGEITSYSGTSLVLDVDYTEGSGTNASWNIGLAGARGATGATGATGPQGPAGADGTGSGDFSSNTSTSVDSEIVLFSGTGGKTGKRATTTGLLKAASGVLSAAVSGTDYAPATSGSSILKGNGSGGFSAAVADTDYTANAFKTIAVSGQSDVVADSASDTLTLVGSGVTITTNAGTDTITFTAASGFTVATAQATTSGNTKTFTGLTGAKVIHLNLSGVSTNGTGAITVQIGTGSLTATGYVGNTVYFNGVGGAIGSYGAYSTAFEITDAAVDASLYSGTLILTLEDSSNNIWSATGSISADADGVNPQFMWIAGKVPLSGALDRIAIITANTFDAGSVGVAWSA